MLKQALLSALFVGSATLGFVPGAQAEDASSTARRLWAGPTAAEIRGEDAPQVPVQRADVGPKFSVQDLWNGDLNYGQRRADLTQGSVAAPSTERVEFGSFLSELYTGSSAQAAKANVASDAGRADATRARAATGAK